MLGEECWRALLFWFCFTGCDTVSQFCGRGKKTAWDVWRSYPKVTDTFVRLSGLYEIERNDKNHLETFLCLLYDRTTSLAKVNDCRRSLFVKKGRLIDICQATSNCLDQHTKRARYQANIWINCLCINQLKAKATEWGWILKEKGLF